MTIKNLDKHFVQRLYESKSFDDKFSVLEDEVKSAGFDDVLYTFVPKLSFLTEELKPVFKFSDGYNPLLKNYRHKNYDQHDFVIRLIVSGKLDTIDWWQEAEKITLSDKEKEVNHVAKENFGISKGISFPTLSNDVGFAGVSIISFDPKYLNTPVNSGLLNHLKNCSKMFHDHTMVHQDARYEFILPILKTLTPKKKVVIKHLISGQPMKNICDQDITIRYAEKLLLELRKSFGDISKNELIYLLGLLNISEYL